jgi:hypothetical protein
MSMSNSWMTLNVLNAVRLPPRDAPDARINGTALGIANSDNGRDIRHYVTSSHLTRKRMNSRNRRSRIFRKRRFKRRSL